MPSTHDDGKCCDVPSANWQFLEIDEDSVDILADSLNLRRITARLLAQRGYSDPKVAKQFLYPTMADLHDPFRLADLDIAVERIVSALSEKETIAIHGDYDVDGVVSTAILKRVLTSLGGTVVHFIPNRFTDGYGVQSVGIRRLYDLGARVIITVDCGIRSLEAAAEAKRLDVDLIVTDHHEPAKILPSAFAIVNPKRKDCAYPDKDLAGVGVTFKLVQALCIRSNKQHWLPSVLKLASIGTLADVVPLRGENRVIAKVGLDELTFGTHAQGIELLLKTSGLDQKQLSSDDVTFRLAPRINAAGRMSSAEIALELLLAQNSDCLQHTLELVKKIETNNDLRKQTETETVRAATQLIEEVSDFSSHQALVVWGYEWHRGVIGIVASRLVDHYAKPAIVISVGTNVAHGSARSVPGFDLLEGLQRCEDLLLTFGGHTNAAGLTIKPERLMEFRKRFVDYTEELLTNKTLDTHLTVDSGIGFGEIGPELVQDLLKLEPFGNGNPKPIFHTSPVSVAHGPRVLQSKHLKMTLEHKNNKFTGLWWGGASNLGLVEKYRKNLHIAYSLAENMYRGKSHIQLNIAGIRKAV